MTEERAGLHVAAELRAARERAARAYHDPRYPPRRCDACGREYTGPAVYCSLACAESDAE